MLYNVVYVMSSARMQMFSWHGKEGETIPWSILGYPVEEGMHQLFFKNFITWSILLQIKNVIKRAFRLLQCRWDDILQDKSYYNTSPMSHHHDMLVMIHNLMNTNVNDKVHGNLYIYEVDSNLAATRGTRFEL